jgi:hypothetical protein
MATTPPALVLVGVAVTTYRAAGPTTVATGDVLPVKPPLVAVMT